MSKKLFVVLLVVVVVVGFVVGFATAKKESSDTTTTTLPLVNENYTPETDIVADDEETEPEDDYESTDVAEGEDEGSIEKVEPKTIRADMYSVQLSGEFANKYSYKISGDNDISFFAKGDDEDILFELYVQREDEFSADSPVPTEVVKTIVYGDERYCIVLMLSGDSERNVDIDEIVATIQPAEGVELADEEAKG